ncbi:MAG: EAL domain-containing protein [Steroidobacteraceae bacterium]|nr:EAL domain-containing protein [Steroidobacteraceae bacterium]
MNRASLKLKYVVFAVVATIAGSVLLSSLLLWHAKSESRLMAEIATAEYREAIGAELHAHAGSIASHVADAAAPALAARDRAALTERLAERLQVFAADPAIVSIEIIGAGGETLYRFARAPQFDQPLIERDATQPIRPLVPGYAGASAPQTLGSARVELATHDTSPSNVGAPLTAASRAMLNRALAILGAVLLFGLVSAVAVALWAARGIERPIHALIRSADRIGQGDLSRPTDIARRDEIGELQQALERMRHKLRQTTITKNYLNSVLTGMTDAVFVTSPDGLIRVANLAAQRLLGYGEDELNGRSIVSLLDGPDRDSFDVLQASNETREAVVRTRKGQTIPVSLTGSAIATDDPQFQGCIFVARNITDRKRAERRIRYLARYDALTKVPNRMQFQHLLQQAIARSLRNRQIVALLYLDVDHFKEVNDTFGHAAGDRTLEILTERLNRVLPKDSVVGRLAGDEFAVMIDSLAGDTDHRGPIGQLARSILAETGKVFQLGQHEVFLTTSIGIAFCPRDAENVIDLIRNADAAMYYSKQNGGNTFAFYAPEMNAASVERLMLKSKLRRALERDELIVNYQPKVDLRSGRIVGAEGLLRWRLPGYGDIPPSQFIPLAEESNLILEIGEWVLNRVCLDYRTLRREVADPGRISLNLSLKQLRQASFIVRCRSVFRRHGVSPAAFELEITESTLMADAKRTVHLLGELHAMGLHLSIDDFGTGYSSLSALQQFPIGTLKIDQSFVQNVTDDPGDATIVRTIIDMGRSLGMDVIAEGVETARQLAFLRDHRCDYGQGRLFGDTLPLEELLALLVTQQNGIAPFAPLLPPAAGTAGLSA